MNDADDRLTSRIRDLLYLAQHDAPEPHIRRVVAPAIPVRAGRRFAVVGGAAAVLVSVGALAWQLRGDGDSSTMVGATDPTVAVTSTSLASTTTSATLFDPTTCGTSLNRPYEEQGSIHTVMPNPQPVDVSVELALATACTGGTATLRVAMDNRGTEEVDLGGTQVILAVTGAEKFVVGTLPSTPLPPGGSAAVDVPVSVPAVPPGSYQVAVYGIGDWATLTVVGPAVCRADQLRSEVVLEDGTSTDGFQVTQVTNEGAEPCVLLQPMVAYGVRAGADPVPISLQSGQGFFEGGMTPLADFVLDAGESAELWVTTSSACLDGVVQPDVFDSLVVELGISLNTRPSVIVGRDVDVVCGLWLTGWLEPTAE